ncbi:prevent-host-death family protein [Streptomyces sp. NPDC000410]|uniref:prevent-host-death family protein n=1 Tax=Streptomyces sp. NPDC000410 TaxID=3154254 RepID=UPI0033242A3B
MTPTEAVTYSELSKRPGDVAERLTRTERLRIERRDGADLVLTTMEREERREEAVTTIAHTFAALIKTDDGARALLLALPEIFPWVRHLDEDEVREMTVELVNAVRDAAELDVFGPLNGVVAGWKATARIKADPDEYAEALRLRADHDTDFGPVTAP